MRLITLVLAPMAFIFVNAVDLETLRIQTSTEYVSSANANSYQGLRGLKRDTYLETATELVKTVAPDAEFKITPGHYTGNNGISHVYFQQTAHDLEIANAIFNVNIDKNGHIFSYGNGFFNGSIPALGPKSTSILNRSPTDALEVVISTLKLPIEATSSINVEQLNEAHRSYIMRDVRGVRRDPTAKLEYLVKPDGILALTWKVSTDVQDASYSSYVTMDEEIAKVIAVLDHVDRWTYEVYPFGIDSPADGSRKLIEDPHFPQASPFSWHNSFNTTTKRYYTAGNNVVVGAHPQLLGPQYLANSSTGSFNFPYEPDQGTPWDFYEASVTQAFYTTNMLHDLYYILGFTPKAGNNQMDNNGEGGLGNDAVIVNVQKNGAFNNGVFFQAVDGVSPEMNIYPFDKTDPMRDSSFDAGIVIHEYTHGMSDRMTGPPDNRDCLSAFEPDGMAEGWSDFYAAALTVKPEADRNSTYAASPWAFNNATGARLRLYSTNIDINEFTYSSVNSFNRVHQVGTVWCTMLYEMLWNLIDKHGKNDNPRPEMVNGIPTDGKFLAIKLTTDGFALQPCNPSIVQARNAIIDADVALTGGENACEIWRAFAKRGLGATAVTAEPRVDSFDLPEDVC